jgi:hypothetical protein
MKKSMALLLLLILSMSVCLAGAESLVMTFVGDCSIGDAIQYRNVENSYHRVVADKGTAWPFSLVSHVTLADDLTVANLEGSMTTLKKHKDITYPLMIDPSHVQVLLDGGIDVVNTANNHALDFMQQGYHDTLSNLDSAGIAHFGTLSPPSTTKINRQVVLERKGIKIGFIGFTYPQQKDLRHIEAAAKSLREAGCDLVILSLHWGRETHMTPSSSQYGFAREVFKYDIDLIYGHHPHVVQPIALYDGRPVFFSTGNFTFGTMSKVDPSTGLFQVEYDLSGDKPVLSALRVIPCETRGSGDYRPTPVTDEAQRREIFKKLTFKKPPKGFEALPESFLKTGEVSFLK